MKAIYTPSPMDPHEPKNRVHFTANGQIMRSLVEELLPQAMTAALAKAGLTLDQMDWVAPHQPNAVWLERLVAKLNLPSARVPRVVHRTANVPSAMVPFGLHELLSREDGPKSGDHVLMMAIGAGVAYGAAVLRVD
jgi:3-oxoacyl-[acyl-carrier-protein] synthase-3